MQIDATFNYVLTLEDIGHEVEVYCSANLDSYDEIMDVVIESIYSHEMSREITSSEVSKKQLEKIFDKAIKKLSKQNHRVEYDNDTYEVQKSK